MVCSSCVVLEDLANTFTAGYVSLGSAGSVTFLLGGESDFHAATPDAIAFFSATVGLPSFFVVVCPDAATLLLDGEDDFCTAMPAFAFVAALMG